jgi:hypothetical protein
MPNHHPHVHGADVRCASHISVAAQAGQPLPNAIDPPTLHRYNPGYFVTVT